MIWSVMPMDWDEETHVSEDSTRPAEVAGDRDRAYLIVLAGSNVGEMFKISAGETVLGRGQTVDIFFFVRGRQNKRTALH